MTETAVPSGYQASPPSWPAVNPAVNNVHTLLLVPQQKAWPRLVVAQIACLRGLSASPACAAPMLAQSCQVPGRRPLRLVAFESARLILKLAICRFRPPPRSAPPLEIAALESAWALGLKSPICKVAVGEIYFVSATICCPGSTTRNSQSF
jgi:hypothetical protein